MGIKRFSIEDVILGLNILDNTFQKYAVLSINLCFHHNLISFPGLHLKGLTDKKEVIKIESYLNIQFQRCNFFCKWPDSGKSVRGVS